MKNGTEEKVIVISQSEDDSGVILYDTKEELNNLKNKQSGKLRELLMIASVIFTNE